MLIHNCMLMRNSGIGPYYVAFCTNMDAVFSASHLPICLAIFIKLNKTHNFISLSYFPLSPIFSLLFWLLVLKLCIFTVT